MREVKLVLKGGGTRIGVYVGAYKALVDAGVRVAEVIGTSLGAIIAAAIASGRSPNDITKLAKAFLPSTMLDPRWLPFWPFADGTAGIFRGDSILENMRRQLPVDYNDVDIPLHVVAHNWSKGVNRVFSKGDLPLHVRASMSLPIFDMVRIDGDLYEDGGVSGNFLLDYDGWTTDPDIPVLGLSIVSPRPARRDAPRTHIARLRLTVGDTIDAHDREHIEGAKWASVIQLPTTQGSLDLGLTTADIDAQIEEGYAATRAGLEKYAGVLR